MPDDRSSGPRRIVPVPGLLDIDSVEDANFAEALGEDDTASTAGDGDDPLSPPDPPPLTDAEESEEPAGPARASREAPDDVDYDWLGDDAPSASVDTPTGPELADAPPPPPLRADGPPVDPADGEPEAGEEAPEPEADAADVPNAEPEPEPAPSEPDTDPETPRAPEPAPPAAPGEPPTTEPGDEPEGPTPPEEPSDPAAALPVPVADRPPVSGREVVESAREATRGRGRELVQLVVKHGKAHVPEPPAKAVVPDAGPPRMVGRVGQLIPFLQVIPWVLAALFAVSFWWDFDGQAVVLFGETFALDGLLKVLTVSGLIGFGTNWLAITMLFQPREKRAIIPQGLIPAQRERVIYRLSEAISRELINADIIKQKIKDSGVIGRYRDLALGVVRGVVEDPGFRADLKTLAQDYAQEVLGSEPVRREVARLAVEKVEQQAGGGLGGVALRLYRTFAEDDFQRRIDRALDELPGAVSPLLDRIDAALDAVPAKVEARADEIEEAATSAVLSFVEGFDVRTMISERARQFDEGQLEGLLKSTSNEQLNYIKYLGAILGVFGGFVIWQPLGALVLFVTIGLALWGIDEALVRARRSRE
ncbi:DUF445 domain-containing protein [Rubrivirga marina]|uniref:DUF445 domain-containing protein n=1 Tax=Rubrivirga marina TaxID=1196024 RepID=A0A271IZJ7_9BACT|nr:DUF445 family protein [Rubrivirga marina]PAP76224.1 hypothetical protein BSZ37_07090 [Rubrivirga marina]